jgi:hypothetical protein
VYIEVEYTSYSDGPAERYKWSRLGWLDVEGLCADGAVSC